MRKILGSIILAVAALVGSGATAQCITPEYVDSLRIELALREMPEKIIYLPYALADQASDPDRAGLWAISALDALRWAGLHPEMVAEKVSEENPDIAAESQADSQTDAQANSPADSSTDAQVAPQANPQADSTVTEPKNRADLRTDPKISTAIALDRLQELYSRFGDWDKAIVAYAESPTAAASLRDSTALAEAVIIKSLREAQSKFALVPAHNAFEGLEALAESRKAEREALLQAEANARKARLDSLRKVQAASVDKITYTIRSGDTLGGIAARYRVKVSDLKRWNGLSSDFIREGRKLVIYKH